MPGDPDAALGSHGQLRLQRATALVDVLLRRRPPIDRPRLRALDRPGDRPDRHASSLTTSRTTGCPACKPYEEPGYWRDVGTIAGVLATPTWTCSATSPALRPRQPALADPHAASIDGPPARIIGGDSGQHSLGEGSLVQDARVSATRSSAAASGSTRARSSRTRSSWTTPRSGQGAASPARSSIATTIIPAGSAPRAGDAAVTGRRAHATPRGSSSCPRGGAGGPPRAGGLGPACRRARDLSPRPLLPAAAREPVARRRRAAGLGRARTTTGTRASPPSATRRTPPRACSTRRTARRRRRQLRVDELQLRADAARLAGRARRPPSYAALRRADAPSRARTGGTATPGRRPTATRSCRSPREPTRSPRCRWGRRDFEHRFGRAPEGMWLPETAADDETLEVLAEAGVEVHHPVAAPGARASGGSGTAAWDDVGERDRPQPRLSLAWSARPAVWPCSSTMGPSRARSRSRACSRAASGWWRGSARPSPRRAPGRNWCTAPPTVRSFGHHSRFGEMALAAALRTLGRGSRARGHQLRRVPRGPSAHA